MPVSRPGDSHIRPGVATPVLHSAGGGLRYALRPTRVDSWQPAEGTTAGTKLAA